MNPPMADPIGQVSSPDMPKTDLRHLDRVIGDSAAALRDIDQLQEQIAALTAALEHRERLATLGTIAGLIAHEFNNILTPVMSYAQMALARPEDRELAAKALGRVVEGTERAAAIATTILGFVRDDSGAHVPRGTLERASVRGALDAALECMARDPARDGIEMVVDVPGELAARIKPVALQHVLLNLLLNARNALLPGGGKLVVRARSVEVLPQRPVDAVGGNADGEVGNGPWVVVEVEDSGRGMGEAELGRLFEPFYTAGTDVPRGTEVGERRRRGTGLGMTICERLLVDGGGTMWVESQLGCGTQVTVVVAGVSNG